MASFNVSSLLARFGKKQDVNAVSSDYVELQKKILFVCTGNIARSASAQYMAQKMAGEDSTWTFDSAGIGAVVGASVAPHIDVALASRDVPYEGHKAKQITQKMVAESALVLVMEKEHLNWIVHEWPQYRNKVHLLREMSRLREQAGRRVDPVSYMVQQDQAPLDSDNIADPYGRGRDAARKAVQEIEDSLTVLLPWLGN